MVAVVFSPVDELSRVSADDEQSLRRRIAVTYFAPVWRGTKPAQRIHVDVPAFFATAAAVRDELAVRCIGVRCQHDEV